MMRNPGIPKDAQRRLGLVVPDFPATEFGNAERLVHRHGRDLRHVFPWNGWLEWSGIRWEADDTGGVARKAKETVRSIYGEAERADDADRRKALSDHARRSESRNRIDAMIHLARSEPGIPVTPEELDSDPWLLNVENGTVDLRTGNLRPHDRDDLITKTAPVEYDGDAQAPSWEKFLETVLPSEALRTFLKRAVGYSLTGDTRERVLFLLHGVGRNGKSTFLEAIRDALGDHAMKTPSETLMAKPAGGIPNDVARLKGVRFVSASETEANRRLAEALVKEITGNDTISARFMRGEWFDFRPDFKIWLATNHKPEILDTGQGIWDRIRLVPFEVRIPEDEVDRELPEKLRDELPGILRWAVEGCLEWQREGLGYPEEVRRATEGYRAEMDLLAAFIEDVCVVREDAWAKFSDLYDAYREWYEDAGEKRQKFETKRSFGDRLKERGFDPDKGTGNVSIRKGIRLREDRKIDLDDLPG